MNWTITVALAAVGFTIPNSALFAQKTCKGFPYVEGQLEIGNSESFFIATGGSTVSFDDVDSVKDAREEATLEAKAVIARFLTETIKNDSEISRLVHESKTVSGSSKENVRIEAIRRTKSLRNSAQALLRGIQVIGSCYTPGAEVRVTVGVKEDTVVAAEILAGVNGSSVSKQSTVHPGSANRDGGGRLGGVRGRGEKRTLTGAEGYNDTSGIDTFKQPK